MSAQTVNEVRRAFYLDSVALMRISSELSALKGVLDAALMVGTPANIEILRKAELLTPAGESATPNDLIIAFRTADHDTAATVLAEAEAGLARRQTPTEERGGHRPHSLEAAVDQLPAANLALISVPGVYAAGEARKALRRGLNVMIFSDNVAVGEERSLKQEAQRSGLLVMGPDCGTAIVRGKALGFANAVPRGRIGIVAASGTGMQEVSVLVARAGQGLSHGLGVGGRDLSDDVGGISTLTAIDLLEQDAATERLLIISKPPGNATARLIAERLRRCPKPVVLCFLGHEHPDSLSENVRYATTLREAAEALVGKRMASDFQAPSIQVPGNRRCLRGLFTGGSMCIEAQSILRQAGIEFASNVPIPGARSAPADRCHTLLDLGADEYTVGRPHPMIDPALRDEMLSDALRDPDVAVVLMDVILGFGGHHDPAGSIADVVETAPEGHPPVIASVCGLDGDPQGYHPQLRALQGAGVVVAPSNAHAGEAALRLIEPTHLPATPNH